MKRFFAIALTLLMVLSMVGCSAANPNAKDNGDIVFTGELKVTKLEVYLDGGDHRYVMALKNDDVALLFRVTAATYLTYEIGDIITGEVKHSIRDYYQFRFNGEEDWIHVIETIGFDD